MIDWVKIRQTGFSRLFLIGFYRLFYRMALRLEKIRLNFSADPFRPEAGGRLAGDTTGYAVFKKYCRFGEATVTAADAVCAGRVELFGQSYPFRNEWLTDPVTGRKVDRDVFFVAASTFLHPDTDVKFLMELNKLYHLVVLACAYSHTKEEKYLYALEEALCSWTKTVRYERSVVNKIIMDLAYRNLNLIYVSILCGENTYFQEKIYPSLVGIVRAQTATIRKFATPKWFKTGNESNHTVGEMAGFIVSELWLSKQIKGYRIRADWAVGYLNKTLDKLLTKNGAYLEQSFNYSKIVFDFLFVLDVFVRDCGNRPALYTPHYLDRLRTYLSLLSGDDFSPDFGDSDSSRVALPFYYSNHYLQTGAGEKAKSSLYDPESGQIVWNSSGAENARLFIRCGRFSVYRLGAAVHCHNDLLSLCFSVKKEKIFVDRGSSYYNRSMDFRNRDRSAAVHNCLSVEGTEPAVMNGKWSYKSYPVSRIDRVELADTCFRFAGQIGYGGYIIRREIDCPAGNEWRICDTIEPLPAGNVILNYLLNPLLASEVVDKYTVGLRLESGAYVSVTCSVPITLEDTEIFEIYSKPVKSRRIYSCFPAVTASYPITTVIKLLS